MRFARFVIAMVLVGLTASSQASGYGSLRRVGDATSPRFGWEVTAAYFPHGREGAGIDVHGNYFTYTRFTGETQLSLSGSWKFIPCVTVGVAVSDCVVEIREHRTYDTGKSEETIVSSQVALASSSEFRLAPGTQLDPRIKIKHSTPDVTEVAASLGYVLDPVVIGGMLGIRMSARDPSTYLNLAISAALVANSRLSVAASGQWSIPVGVSGLPTSTIRIHLQCSLDAARKLNCLFRFAVSSIGQTTRIGLEGSATGFVP